MGDVERRREIASWSMAKLVIVPRWAGGAGSDWYPWLTQQAAESLDLTVSYATLLPTPSAPEVAPTIASVREAITDPSDTYVIGHSVGARAALAAARDLSASLRGLLLVAGWFTVDRPWDSIVPWTHESLSGPPRAARFRVVLSDNDPYTTDHAETRARFESLGATVTIVSGAKHFNASHEPAVLDALRELVDR
jgi:predicted alpha/beta hydrolase family esterase